MNRLQPIGGTEKRIIHCENCGADTILDHTAVAEFCAFCGSSHIVRNESSVGIAPESLIPFTISRKNAETGFTKWIKHRFWAPRKLKTSYQAQRITGVYIPFWTYDADTRSTYTAEAGTYYYVTETEWVEEDGERKQVEKQVKKTRWEYTSGSYSRFFNDILINASKKVNDKLIRKLEPFDLTELTHYNTQYMSGFLAERYSVTLKEGWSKATPIMDEKIENGIRNQIDADEIRNLNIDTGFYGVTYKHILLPIWVSSFIYRNKIYQYLVNGQTGEVQGKYPLSVVKILITILLLVAVIAGIGAWLFSN